MYVCGFVNVSVDTCRGQRSWIPSTEVRGHCETPDVGFGDQIQVLRNFRTYSKVLGCPSSTIVPHLNNRIICCCALNQTEQYD